MSMNRSGRARARAFVVTAVSLSSVSGLASAGGLTREWAAAVSGFFQDDFNWSPSIVPGAADEANISRDGEFTVSFAQNAVSDRLRVNAGMVTLNLGGRVYSLLRDSNLSTDTASLLVGGTGSVVPRLTITNGELRLFSGKIGEAGGAEGQLFVDGANARATIQRNLFVGLFGRGDILVSNGAHATANNAIVGFNGAASTEVSFLEAFSGGTIEIAQDLQVAEGPGGRGIAQSTFGSTLTAGRLLVGRGQNAVGTVNSLFEGSLIHISGDAILGGNGEATLRNALGGSIVIDGTLEYRDGSVISVGAGMLDVGSLRRSASDASGITFAAELATLRVRNDLNSFDLGFNTFALNGQMRVDGAFIVDDDQEFRIDGPFSRFYAGSIGGNGQFGIREGDLTLGTLTLGAAAGLRQSLAVGSEQTGMTDRNDFRVEGHTGIQAGGSLSVTRFDAVFDGTFVNQGALTIDQSVAEFNGVGIFNLNGLVSTGETTITDSTINGVVITGVGSSLAVGGEVVFNGNVQTRVGITDAFAGERGQPTIEFNGGLELGFNDSGIHRVAFDADVAFGAGNTLVLEFGSPAAEQFDALTVNGSLALDGGLDISLRLGYTPTMGDEFRFLSADSFSGMFSDLTLASLPGDLVWDTRHIGTGLMRIVPTPATAMLLAFGALAGVARRRAR